MVIGTDARPNAFGSNFMFVLGPDNPGAWRTYAPPPNMESATLTATTDGTTIFAAARPQYLKAPAPEPLIVMAFDFTTGELAGPAQSVQSSRVLPQARGDLARGLGVRLHGLEIRPRHARMAAAFVAHGISDSGR